MKPHKRQLSDKDIEAMENSPCERNKEEGIRNKKIYDRALRLQHCESSSLFLLPYSFIDLHGHTEEQAWDAIVGMLDQIERYARENGNKIALRRAQVITGASGILKQKFQQWAADSIISHRILSCKLINSGCYEIVVRKNPPC